MIPVDVMLCQDLFNGFDTGFYGGLIAGSAVLSQQIFQYVRGNDGITLDGLHKILADNESLEVCIDFLVKFVHRLQSSKSQNRW